MRCLLPLSAATPIRTEATKMKKAFQIILGLVPLALLAYLWLTPFLSYVPAQGIEVPVVPYRDIASLISGDFDKSMEAEYGTPAGLTALFGFYVSFLILGSTSVLLLIVGIISFVKIFSKDIYAYRKQYKRAMLSSLYVAVIVVPFSVGYFHLNVTGMLTAIFPFAIFFIFELLDLFVMNKEDGVNAGRFLPRVALMVCAAAYLSMILAVRKTEGFVEDPTYDGSKMDRFGGMAHFVATILTYAQHIIFSFIFFWACLAIPSFLVPGNKRKAKRGKARKTPIVARVLFVGMLEGVLFDVLGIIFVINATSLGVIPNISVLSLIVMILSKVVLAAAVQLIRFDNPIADGETGLVASSAKEG